MKHEMAGKPLNPMLVTITGYTPDARGSMPVAIYVAMRISHRRDEGDATSASVTMDAGEHVFSYTSREHSEQFVSITLPIPGVGGEGTTQAQVESALRVTERHARASTANITRERMVSGRESRQCDQVEKEP